MRFCGLFCLTFFIAVAICNLGHDVETVFHLRELLTASGNLFGNMSDARETAILQFPRHHSYLRCYKKLHVIEAMYTLTPHRALGHI